MRRNDNCASLYFRITSWRRTRNASCRCGERAASGSSNRNSPLR
jgi:hypothetical protein